MVCFASENRFAGCNGQYFSGLSRIQRVYVDAIKYHMSGTFFELTRDLHTLSRAEVQKRLLQFSVIKGDEDKSWRCRIRT